MKNFESYSKELLVCAQSVFGERLPSESLPLIDYHLKEDILSIYLLSSSCDRRKRVKYFEETVIQSMQVDILSSRNIVLPSSLLFIELLVPRPKKSFEVNDLIKKIPWGYFGNSKTKAIDKTEEVYEQISTLIYKQGKYLKEDIFREVQHFFLHTREAFRDIRSINHICRIIVTHYLFYKDFEKKNKTYPSRRHLYLKLKKENIFYPFGSKEILSLTVGCNALSDYECFEHRHIINAIKRLIPDIKSHKDSVYVTRHEEIKFLITYLEIEKISGEAFTLEDLRCLKNCLSDELKNSIEHLSPTLFTPRNEEELLRNIVHLSNELQYAKDLPQVVISFQGHRQDILKFNVVLLRIVRDKTLSLKELSGRLPKSITYIQELSTQLGQVRKNSFKEANVFSLEIESSLFLRKNHSIDLIKARRFIVEKLKLMIGDFRDYNGGLLLKQNEQLEAIKQEIKTDFISKEFLIENLFYSFSPSIMQTYLTPLEGSKVFSLFLECLDKELSRSSSSLFHSLHENFCVAVVKTTNSEVKEPLEKRIKSFSFELLKFTFGQVEVDGFLYLCYLYINSDKAKLTDLINLLEQAIKESELKQKRTQVLKLALPRSAQSLDPRISGDRTSGVVISMLFERLMRYNRFGEIEPAIASHVRVLNKGLTYHFHLKKTQWSNGLPLQAYDFEYAWKNILRPDFNFPYAFLFFPIKNAEAVKNGEKPLEDLGIQAIDPYILSVELEYPTHHFLELTANWLFSPLCREIDQKHPGWAYHNAENYVCNGPFKLKICKFNNDLELVKNSHYWDATSVKLDSIHLNSVQSENAVSQMFKCGEIDWIGDPFNKISPSAIKELKDNNILETASQFGIFWIQLNQNHFLFKNSKIRKALAYGINRKIIIDDILKSDDIPAFGLFPPSYNKTSLFTTDDIHQAIILFQEGLKELKVEHQDLPTLIITLSEVEEHTAIMQEVGNQWQNLFKLKIKYEKLSWHLFFEKLHHQNFQIGGLVWYPRYNDPSYFFDLCLFREKGLNITSWVNESYRNHIEQAKRANSSNEQIQLLEKAEEILMREMPVIPLFYQKFRYSKNPKLKNYFFSNVNQISFQSAFLYEENKF